MAIQASARGCVVFGPDEVSTGKGHITVLLVRDLHAEPDEVEYQVVCRDAHLSQSVRESVHLGDTVVVIGAMKLRRVSGPIEDDLAAARVSVEATSLVRILNPA